MTPPARWRPDGLPTSVFVIGPATCKSCGALVWYGRSRTRVQGETVVGEVTTWREWGRYAAHAHAPVKGLRRTLTPRVPKATNPYPQLANARAEWENRQAGTSSESPTLSHDAAALLVPGAAASSRSEGRY